MTPEDEAYAAHKIYDSFCKRNKRHSCTEIEKQRMRTYYLENRDKILAYRKIYNKAYREKNRLAIREQSKFYYEANKSTLGDKRKDYYLKNKERIAAQRKLYREKNKTKVKLCMAKASKKYREANKEKRLAMSRIYYQKNKEKLSLAASRKRYKLTQDQYNNLLMSQGGLCASCGKKCSIQPRLAIDHDHATGKVRGLLCHKCNCALGMLYDSPDLIRKLLEYILKHTQLSLVVNS